MTSRLRTPLVNAAVAYAVLILIGSAISGDRYYMTVATSAVIIYMLAASFNLVFGYAGLLTIGHAAFYGVGAYASVIATTRLEWLPWFGGVLIGGVAAGVLGALLAYPTARLRTEFLALATLAFGAAVEEALDQFAGVTGGVNGFIGVPEASLFGRTFQPGTTAFFLLAGAVAVLIYLLIARLLRSRLGRSLHALRDSELASQSVGINPTHLRSLVFGASSGMAGVAGAMFAASTLYIVPSQFGFPLMIQLFAITLLGGLGTQAGPMLGAILLAFLTEGARGLGEWEHWIYAGSLLALLLLLPGGVVSLIKRIAVGRFAPKQPTHVAAVSAERPVRRSPAAHQVLDVHEVSVQFGGVLALDKPSVQLQRGEVVALIGPNGAGKTTLVNVITGVLRPSEGDVRLDDRSILGLSRHEIARLGVVRTFQHPQLSPGLTVLQNAMLGLDRSATATVPEAFLHTPRSVRDERRFAAEAMEALAQVGIAQYADQLVASVAYGVQRRVELARALVTNPSFLLLDEAGAGLNDQERERLIDAVNVIVADRGPGCLMIDHNMDMVRSAASRVVVLDQGRLLVEGPTEEVLADHRVAEVYLGVADDEGVAVE